MCFELISQDGSKTMAPTPATIAMPIKRPLRGPEKVSGNGKRIKKIGSMKKTKRRTNMITRIVFHTTEESRELINCFSLGSLSTTHHHEIADLGAHIPSVKTNY